MFWIRERVTFAASPTATVLHFGFFQGRSFAVAVGVRRPDSKVVRLGKKLDFPQKSNFLGSLIILVANIFFKFKKEKKALNLTLFDEKCRTATKFLY